MRTDRFLFASLALSGSLFLPAACSDKDAGPASGTGGASNPHRDADLGPNYGDGLIGYKMSAEAREAQSDDTIGLSGSGGSSSPSGEFGGDGDGDGDGDAVAMGGFGGSTLQSGTPGRIRTAQSDPVLSLVEENPFFSTTDESTSTFSIDVDSGSYTLSRAAVRAGFLPDPEDVRVEEFLNYFHFHYKPPAGEEPLSLYTEWSACPWNPERDLLMVGVQGQEVSLKDAPPLNLVYLIDVSGSMGSAMKLPLLIQGFRMLTSQLRDDDRVSIVTYAAAERVVLDGALGSDKETIDAALSGLQASGSTNGSGGIQKAYELAQQYFVEGGMNRVLLATDGDFNVGLSDVDELVEFISEKRDTGVFLSVYGYGSAWDGGNYQDEVGEQLADNGNGVYFYIDGVEETRRAFMHTVTGSLITVAKDVKLQLEFNPEFVKGYRLIGYENRVLSNSSFNDDSVDAAEMGAGMSVTALYEIIPADSSEGIPDPEPGTVPAAPSEGEGGDAEDAGFSPPGASEVAALRLRFKESDSIESEAMTLALPTADRREVPSYKFLFAASISEFALQLQGSQYLPAYRSDEILDQIEDTLVFDGEGAIEESLEFIQLAQELQ